MPDTHVVSQPSAGNSSGSSSNNNTSGMAPRNSGRNRGQGQSQQRHNVSAGALQPRNTMDSATVEATSRKIISVLALDAGFEGITASALEALTRAFESYTQQIYSTAHSFAELGGRTRPNLHDLQQAFTDMRLNPATLASYARKASRSKTPLLRGPLQETIARTQKKKEKKTVLLDSDIEDNSDSDDDEPPTTSVPGLKVTARTIVPDHLPPFPSKHSYKQTPVFVRRPTDPQRIRELNAEQSRLVESNLKRLMAAENKVAMATAHKDGSSIGVAPDLLMVKEEQEFTDGGDQRALSKLEALPIVNYEFSRRQQQVNASQLKGGHQAQLHEMQGGHRRGESLSSNLSGGGGVAGGSMLALKAEWRKGRRRMRKEQQNAMDELEQNHKRPRQTSDHGARPWLVSMDVDP